MRNDNISLRLVGPLVPPDTSIPGVQESERKYGCMAHVIGSMSSLPTSPHLLAGPLSIRHCAQVPFWPTAGIGFTFSLLALLTTVLIDSMFWGK